MALAFLLFAFLATSGGIPLTPNPLHSTNIEMDEYSPIYVLGRELPECLKLPRCRTTSQIVWSCVTTIFACTWVAIHPNLPGPRDSGFQRFRRRGTIAILTIIAPELIAIFAARQWRSAKGIKRKFNEEFNDGDDPDLSFLEILRSWFTVPFYAIQEWFMGPPDEVKRKWTVTHGFFVQMGGFMMYHDGKPVQVLTFDRLLKAIERGEIDVPHIPEEDITDKSKGDVLSKLIVVIQTTWFVAQCLGRWVSHLPVTELEVSTLSYAVLNAFIYAFWWSKPQGILVPIKLEFLPRSSPSNHEDDRREESTGPFIEEEFDKGSSHWMCWKLGMLAIDSTSLFKQTCKFLPFIVLEPLRVALKTLGSPHSETASTDSARKFEVGRSRVPMFYVDNKHGADSDILFIFILIFPPMFGGIHLTLWSASFYTSVERLLWRISALYITMSTLVPPLMLLLVFLLENLPKLPLNTLIESICGYLFPVLVILITCLYPVARGFLILISLHTLAHLPEGAYYEVHWAHLLPHV